MLQGKIAVITGASSGIGEATARALSRNHATVVIAARRRERLERLAEELRSAGATCLTVPCDVTDRSQAEELVATAIRHFGRLDILVNNAGRGHLAAVEDTTDEMIKNMLAVNVVALWYTTRPALRQMRMQRSGHIINVSSIAGKIGFPFNSAYVAAKYACVGFTHALRQELIETGIHASVVIPASVKTEWAEMTEGGAMLPFFSRSGPAIKRIAAERGVSLPKIEGILPPSTVAESILECLRHPVAEVYTHKGSKEFAELAAHDREAAELQQAPIVLGEREAYEAGKRER